jgi:nicotinamidase-related amidase
MLIDTDSFDTQRLASGEVLEPEETALIIIDMMNRFCNPVWLAQGNHQKAEWFARELDYVIPNVTDALRIFREAGALVVHAVCARWTLDRRDAPLHMRERDYDLFDTPGMSVIDQLAPLPGEIMIRKTTGSVFTGTGLEYLLRQAGIENVVLSGQYGSACVFYSLIQSREFGYKQRVWLEDCILYNNETSKHLFPALVGQNWATLATKEEVSRALAATAIPAV